LVRIQSPDGTKRLELLNESLKNLYDKVFKEFSIEIDSSEWELFLDRDRGKLIPKVGSKMVKSILKHGDMIYLLKSKHDEMEHEDSTPSQESKVFTQEEDEVDSFLRKFDGKIERKRDAQLCHHGDNSKCINCTPIEPFDLDYLASRDPPIKFMSFHAYIKKLQSGADKLVDF
jgi:nuclear protein localization family protein 4